MFYRVELSESNKLVSCLNNIIWTMICGSERIINLTDFQSKQLCAVVICFKPLMNPPIRLPVYVEKLAS